MLLLSASILRVRNEPLGSLLLRFKGVGRDREEDGVGRGSGRVEEGRSGQQGRRVDADAPSLVLLLSASVLRVCDEPPSSSLLRSKGAGTTGSRRQRQSMHSMYCNG